MGFVHKVWMQWSNSVKPLWTHRGSLSVNSEWIWSKAVGIIAVLKTVFGMKVEHFHHSGVYSHTAVTKKSLNKYTLPRCTQRCNWPAEELVSTSKERLKYYGRYIQATYAVPSIRTSSSQLQSCSAVWGLRTHLFSLTVVSLGLCDLVAQAKWEFDSCWCLTSPYTVSKQMTPSEQCCQVQYHYRTAYATQSVTMLCHTACTT